VTEESHLMRSVHSLNDCDNVGHHPPPPRFNATRSSVDIEVDSPLPGKEQTCDVENVVHASSHADTTRPRVIGSDVSTKPRSIDYAHVRTNWSTFPEGSTCQSVMISKAQVIGGVLTIPKERCRRIFGVVGDFNALEETKVEDIEQDGVDGSLLVPVEEVGLQMDGEVSKTMTTHRVKTNPWESSVVVWSFLDSSRGYLVKMKNYPSQPTQVYLHGLDLLFQEMSVTPWSVLCFAPLGVLGHCQMSVWSSDHPQFASFCSSVTYGWSYGLEIARVKRNDVGQQGAHDMGQAQLGNESVVGETTFRPESLMIKTVLDARMNMYTAVVVQGGKFVALQADGPTKVRVLAPLPAHHLSHAIQNKKKMNKKASCAKSLEVGASNASKGRRRRRKRRAYSENDGEKDDTENTGNDSALMLGQGISDGKPMTGMNLRSRPFGCHQPATGDVILLGGGDAEAVDGGGRKALSERCDVGNSFGVTSLRRRTRKANPHQGHTM
jgi:hypothetical protein